MCIKAFREEQPVSYFSRLFFHNDIDNYNHHLEISDQVVIIQNGNYFLNETI